ncbi:MAG: V-type ATP synthase subunit F [Candidatus Geothermarchaeales archaeon]
MGDEHTVAFFHIAGIAEGLVAETPRDATLLVQKILEGEEHRILFVTTQLVERELTDMVSERGAKAAPLVVINSVRQPRGEVLDLVDVISTFLMEMVEKQ